MTTSDGDADWGGTSMLAKTLDGRDVEILGHADGTGFSVWQDDGEGRMWDMVFSGHTDMPGPEAQAAAAYSDGRARGLFG